MSPSERTPSQDKGEIQSGQTRDKTPGFDPAAAPQETDAEAAGTDNPAEPTMPGKLEFKNQASFADAMRPPESEPRLRPGQEWPLLVIVGIVAVAGAVFGIAALLN